MTEDEKRRDGDLARMMVETSGSNRAHQDECHIPMGGFTPIDGRFATPEEFTPEDWWSMYRHGPKNGWEALEEDKLTFLEFLNGLPKADLSSDDPVATLMTKQGEYAPIDNPLVWESMSEVVKRFNENGHQFHAEHLVEADGSPTLLFERALAYGKVDAFFQTENWKGASRNELEAVLKHVPEEKRSSIPTLHQISSLVSRNDIQASRSR